MNLDASAFVADQELLCALRDKAAPVDCAQNRVLFRQGDEPLGLYIIHRGVVTMWMDDCCGDEVAKVQVQPGSLLGLPGLVGNAGYSMSAEAHAGAEISIVNRDQFSKLMLTEPMLGMMILRVLAAEVRSARLAIAGK